MAEKGGSHMKVKTKTEAPGLKVNPRNSFLAALHVLMVVISLAIHPVVETNAARALP